ncbi:multidrug resistance operon repressor [Pseudomonas aeruginosa BWHPSA008]|nr:multidrug resistance operon repressor [Pseudomonas aeruginosa BWHPSA008]
MNYPVNPDLMPALMAVFQHVRTRIQSELDCQRLDLTPPDVHVLKLIDEQRGLNLQDLGRQMCRDKALITRKIRELEGRNLVRRERNPSDQRSFQLFLTDEGLAIHQHAEAALRPARPAPTTIAVGCLSLPSATALNTPNMRNAAARSHLNDIPDSPGKKQRRNGAQHTPEPFGPP